MKKRNLNKTELYEGVKAMIDAQAAHIHLPQHKLFTLFTLAFQHLLYMSTKRPGIYVIRIQDGELAKRLIFKAKDEVTRRFVQQLVVARRFKFQGSTFFLDFFNLSSWSLTNEVPKDRIQGALIVKNTTPFNLPEELLGPFPKDYYYTSLREFVPYTTLIAFNEEVEGCETIEIPFITEQEKNDKSEQINSEEELDD